MDDPSIKTRSLMLFTISLLYAGDMPGSGLLAGLRRRPPLQNIPSARDILQILDGLSYSLPSPRPSLSRIKKLMKKADHWIRQNVFVVTAEELSLRDVEGWGLGPFFYAWGNPHILKNQRAAVFNSRKPRTTSAHDPWLRVSKTFAEQAIGQGYVLVSSLGNAPYDWVSYLPKSAARFSSWCVTAFCRGWTVKRKGMSFSLPTAISSIQRTP